MSSETGRTCSGAGTKWSTVMKIIKNGKPKVVVKTFKCPYCECVFEADNSEYKTSTYRNEINSYCRCPECGNEAPETFESWRESNGIFQATDC